MLDIGAWHVGAWLMWVIDVSAVVILGLAIIYGAAMWRRRSQDPGILEESDEATRRLYHHSSSERR